MEKDHEQLRSREFLNNDFAVGAKGRIPTGEFYEKEWLPFIKQAVLKRS
jgi:penicillin-binding protein 2